MEKSSGRLGSSAIHRFSKVPVLSFEILWKNYGKSFGAMTELVSHQSASGLGLRSRRLVSCSRTRTKYWWRRWYHLFLHQHLFGPFSSDVLKELDCTKLIDAQETTRVVWWGSLSLLDDLLRPWGGLRFITMLDGYSLCDSTLLSYVVRVKLQVRPNIDWTYNSDKML